jgi:hypothetical protein
MTLSVVMSVGEQPDERNPFWVRCEPCGHHWIAAYLPMPMDKAAKVLGGLHCPNCGNGPMGIFMAMLPEAGP